MRIFYDTINLEVGLLASTIINTEEIKVDTNNNNLNDINETNINNTDNTAVNDTAALEPIAEAVAEVVVETVTEEIATVFDADPEIISEESTDVGTEESNEAQLAQSAFAVFDSQPNSNTDYSSYVAAATTPPRAAAVASANAAPTATSNTVNKNEFAASKSKATVALVLGIVSIVLSPSCLPISLFLSIISFVLASKSKKLSPDNKFSKSAIAAIICSAVGLIICLFSFFFWFLLGVVMITDPEIQAMINEILAEFGYELL